MKIFTFCVVLLLSFCQTLSAQIDREPKDVTLVNDIEEGFASMRYKDEDFNKMKLYFNSNKKFKEHINTRVNDGNQNAIDLTTILESDYNEAINQYGKAVINEIIYAYYLSSETLQEFNKLSSDLDKQIDSLETEKTFFENEIKNYSEDFYDSIKSDFKFQSHLIDMFVEAYNRKDSAYAFSLLHKDFKEYYDEELTIKSKTDYANNYAWGKAMNDSIAHKIVLVDSVKIETISTYYCDRDRLLEVTPYKSIRNFEIKDAKIFRVTEHSLPGFEAYYNERRKKYTLFFKWLSKTHKLTIDDFEFNKVGAEKLKKFITRYSNRN